MKKLTLTLETVTPMFLGGAENTELRAPSFRGVMRYWLRAMLGCVIGDENVDALKSMESSIFGDTQVGSEINIRIRELPNKILSMSDTARLPHKSGRYAAWKKAILPGQPFQLIMTQRNSKETVIWEAACASLSMSLLFGGIGNRSRRGFGTLRIINSSDLSIEKSPAENSQWESFISRVVTSAVTVSKELANYKQVSVLSSPTNGPASFPCGTKLSTIRISNQVFPTAEEAIKIFMTRVPDLNYLGYAHGQSRQASPLWVRPIRTGVHQYNLLLSVLASDFSGADYPQLKTFLNTQFPGHDIGVTGWNQ